VHHLLRDGDTPKGRVGRGEDHRFALACLDEPGWGVVERCGVEAVSLIHVKRAELGFTEPCCVLQHCIENRLQLPRRARDDAQHLGGRRLLLQCFTQIVGALAQLVEQPDILDGDHGLGGEIREKLDLLVGERAYLLAVDDNGADQRPLLEHRYADGRASAGHQGE
jgi:hypothetical protein